LTQLEFQVPYAKGSTTSKAAAERIKGHAAKQRSIVLGFIAAHGPCTDEDISEGLGIAGNSCRPRRLELFRAGLIEMLDESGKTKSGRSAARWVVRK